MREASFWMMPKQLRNLFTRILIHCHPVRPLDLWNEFKLQMCAGDIYQRILQLKRDYPKN